MRPLSAPASASLASAEQSRFRRRIARLWRRRAFRRAVTLQIPALALAGGLVVLASDPAIHAATQARWAELRSALTARPEFAIRRIEIEGASPMVRAEILAALTDAQGASSLDLDAAAVRRRVESLGWVASARVSLEAPEALRVHVRERAAAAVWRVEGEPSLIDASGAVIEPAFARSDHPDLPLIVGEGAAAAVGEALAIVASAGRLRSRVVALTRVGARRWDVAMTGPVPGETLTLMLPERDAPAAMETAADLQRKVALFDRDLVAVDLRLRERPTMRLSARAAERLAGRTMDEEGS